MPVDLAIKTIVDRWDEISLHTNMSKNLFVKVLKFCIMDNRYFQYDGKIYKQKRGLPMGSPASPIVADIMMEKLLDESLRKLTQKPKIITKYVDDLFAIIKETEIERTLTTLNNYHSNIRFTMELEEDGKLPYLDILILRNKKNITVNWYQKNTASGRIMNFHQDNKKILQRILEENNFPKNIIKNLITSFKPRTEKRDIEKPTEKIFKSLIYIPGISERITKSNIFDKNKYDLAHKSNNTVKKLFTNIKDKIPKTETPNVIYEIPCEGNSVEKCKMVYIGTTKNKLKTRISGHKSDIKTRSNSKLQKTALAAHCATTKHQPNFNDVRILQQENNTNKRYTLEMLHINNVPTKRRMNYKTDTDNIAHIYRHMVCKNDHRQAKNNSNNNISQQCNSES
ncbi:uncharacterized protein LOC142235965 [Haematobia irritans]|uniref:uncharacterized protein LOC142235965 n=1 Tax=Haematobia irritans TaxID=7368 RepID=UPI003F4F5D79